MTTTADAAPRPLSSTRPFYWSVRRELWENRSLHIAPLVAAGVVLFGFCVAALHLREARQATLTMDARTQAVVMSLPYDFAAMAIIATGVIVAAFYCLGALHNERRDRSILFWKSLPVSDLTTVLSKAVIPFVVIPVILFVVALVTLAIILLLSTAILAVDGLDPGATFARVPVLRFPIVLAYGVTALSLWFAPIAAWLLLVSAWARRAPFLWAVLPPLALCVVEKIALGSGHFAALLNYRLGGYTSAFSVRLHGKTPVDPLPGLDPVGFLTTPGLWAGLAFAAAFLAAAVWLRHRREPI